MKAADECGKREFDGCTEDGGWVETSISSAEALGETKTFVRGGSAVWRRALMREREI